jgi:hypothetical protein
MLKRNLLFVLVAGALLFSVGCSKKAAAPTGTTAPTDTGAPVASKGGNACGLLSTAEIKTTLGLDMLEGTLTDNGSVTACSFQNADRSVQVNVFRYEPKNDLLVNTRAADPNAKTLTGIGDDALIQENIGSLTFSVGEIGVTIGVGLDATPAQLQEAARVAAGHI